MSIEAKLDALTAAVEANTAIHTKVLAALNSNTKAAKPAAKTAAAAPTETEETTPPAEEKPKPKRKPRAKKTKEPTPDELRKQLLLDVAAFMGTVKAEGSDEDKLHVKEAMGKMLRFVDAQDPNTNKYVIPAIPDDRVAEAVTYFNAIKDGDEPDYPTAEGDPVANSEDDDMSF